MATALDRPGRVRAGARRPNYRRADRRDEGPRAHDRLRPRCRTRERTSARCHGPRAHLRRGGAQGNADHSPRGDQLLRRRQWRTDPDSRGPPPRAPPASGGDQTPGELHAPVARSAAPGADALSARAAHNSRQAGQPVALRHGDRLRGTRRAAGEPGAAFGQGHHGHARLVPRPVRWRPRKGQAARSKGRREDGLLQGDPRDRADLLAETRHAGALVSGADCPERAQAGQRCATDGRAEGNGRTLCEETDRLERHGLQAEPDALRAHHGAVALRDGPAGHQRPDRRHAMDGAHARRQCDAATHPEPGIPGD